jgi:hypothetical protein
MKHTFYAFTLCLAVSAFLPACSKSKNTASTANNNSAGNPSGADSAAPAGGATDLKIKWATGKTYSMEMDLSQNSEINIPNRQQPMKQVLKYIQDFHYAPGKDLDDGGRQVELEFDSSSFNFSQNGRVMINFDSTQKTPLAANNPATQVGAVMKAMLGVPLEYNFGADGTVEKIDGIDALQNRIDAAASPQQRQQMQQMFSEGTLKQYGSIGQSLPDHPVNVGDTWTVDRDITTPAGVMTINLTYTFKGWQQFDGRNCAHLVATGDITSKSPSMQVAGATIDVQSGTVTGDDWFDPALGMLVALNSDQDMTMKITMQGRTMTQKAKQNLRMSLVDVTP